ncbi:bis-aminopropyl spermidine synthase family protein [Sphingomonas melonis]|jgi:N4-bis(aminopropyl)spermidine synthase|nr:bis-aminopropyl spermidine synthase family protein [Sphingomonas melonis]MBX8844490.1 bis-aminopropyl spermidine synthase family protein [Sphingomonas melonis]MBX8852409.1 bis-aminopropyl spermidine synthase family protein [Sphingomonas melonis]MBX8897832.1 bis-aminopropyl spermidine synthase family protein [Sphingomonas melonis]
MAAERTQIDLLEAINAVSDVVQNRPRPIRSIDQIYMKSGDMVMQAELVAHWADGKRLAFIGDGDAISVCVAYLKSRKIVPYGPSQITVFDFDERQVQAIRSFAERKHIRHLNAELYNAREAFPMPNRFDRFYTNPPWGQSNDGASVHVFMERGIEACGYGGQGMLVIADDEELEWPKRVLYTTQERASQLGYFVSRMQPLMHSYHLDDDALLRSCNLFVEALPGNQPLGESQAIEGERLVNFYGRDQNLRMRYIRSKRPLTLEGADENEWAPEFYEDTE